MTGRGGGGVPGGVTVGDPVGVTIGVNNFDVFDNEEDLCGTGEVDGDSEILGTGDANGERV